MRGRRGLAAILLLAVALVDTQFYFADARYTAYINEDSYAWYVFGRNLVLIAILVRLSYPWPRVRLGA